MRGCGVLRTVQQSAAEKVRLCVEYEGMHARQAASEAEGSNSAAHARYKPRAQYASSEDSKVPLRVQMGSN